MQDDTQEYIRILQLLKVLLAMILGLAFWAPRAALLQHRPGDGSGGIEVVAGGSRYCTSRTEFIMTTFTSGQLSSH